MSGERDALLAMSTDVRAMAGHVLVALAEWNRPGPPIWHGSTLLSDAGVTTGEIADRFHLQHWTPERQALNEALTALRRLHLVQMEFDPRRDKKAHWWITNHGLDIAHRLPSAARVRMG